MGLSGRRHMLRHAGSTISDVRERGTSAPRARPAGCSSPLLRSASRRAEAEGGDASSAAGYLGGDLAHHGGMTPVDDENRARALDEARVRRVRLRGAMDDLEAALAAPAARRVADWWAAVMACLQGLRTALLHHVVETEADEGLLTQILTEVPRLASAVDRLRQDHVELSDAVEALLVRPVPRNGDSAVIRDAGLRLLGQLARHRQRGADLLYEAYSIDVGGGG